LAESDVATWKDRAAGPERMARKGYLTETQAQADKQRLRDAESALEKAKRGLKAFPTEPKKLPGKGQDPGP